MTKENISKINEKYPVLLVDLVEDSQDYMGIVKQLLLLNGIHNTREFTNVDLYEKELQDHPNITPHIALLDYKFEGSPLTGYDIMLMLIRRSKHRSLRTKTIMITGYSNPEKICDYFHKGGFAWLNKDRSSFKESLIEKVTEAIMDIQEALEERAWIEGLEDDVITEK